MNFDIGLTPIFSLLIVLLVLSILCDFLLELMSVRLTLCSGRFQNWLYQNLGRNFLSDSFISVAYQMLSFRKRAFFMQFLCFSSVGSFGRLQSLFILVGAFLGMAFSILFLGLISLKLGMIIGGLGFVLSLFTKDQLRDLGVACISFGLFISAIAFFDQLLGQTAMNVHQYQFGPGFILFLVLFSSSLFRTPAPFLLIMSMLHFLVGFNIWLLPFLFFVHGMCLLAPFHSYILTKFRRLRFFILATFVLQILQILSVYLIVSIWHEDLSAFISGKSFLESYLVMLLSYSFYFFFGSVWMLPILFFFKKTSFLKEAEGAKKPSQKILHLPQRGYFYSLHFSLFLLRQEFVKFVTLTHTIFKLSREADVEEQDINESLARYRSVLVRVGDEIKELCFNVGRQRSYRWHVLEILSFYKSINQLELLVEDLSKVFQHLQKEDLNEEWERECRYWLSLQLIVFEFYFNSILGVANDEKAKMDLNIRKSYDVLDRLFQDKNSKNLSKTFYRITESNGTLAL